MFVPYAARPSTGALRPGRACTRTPAVRCASNAVAVNRVADRLDALLKPAPDVAPCADAMPARYESTTQPRAPFGKRILVQLWKLRNKCTRSRRYATVMIGARMFGRA